MRLLLLFIITFLPVVSYAVDVDICHRQTGGAYVLITISDTFVATHERHGDIYPPDQFNYPDNDGDGDGAGTPINACSNPIAAIAGYASTNTDPNDASANQTYHGGTSTETMNAQAKLNITGAKRESAAHVARSFTIVEGMTYVSCNATVDPIDVSLPISATTKAGRLLIIARVSNSIACNVLRRSTDTMIIAGVGLAQTTYTLSTQGEQLLCFSDGSSTWFCSII